jgi:pSer/pThr/pTyr-binding forkhead associated (FHA) protein
MQGFKQCNNGHFYQETLEFCPHCPTSNQNFITGNLDKTIIENEGFNKNMAITNNFDKTQIDIQSTQNQSPMKKQQKIDLSKTYIKTDEVETTSKGEEKSVLRERRKLVGWLVSYTIDSLGRDYRIYEGRNTIGTATVNSIILNTDGSISSQHAVILYRNSMLYIKDNLSTNGTKLNSKDLEPDKSYVFEDKAKIELGDTVFVFRTSL